MDVRKIIKEEVSKFMEDYSEDSDQHMYIGVEEGLPEELSNLIDEFRSMPEEDRKLQPLLWWMLKKSTSHFKMSKEGSEYTDVSKTEGQDCNGCKHMYMGQRGFVCDQVGQDVDGNDDIALGGWCKLWKPTEDGVGLTEKMDEVSGAIEEGKKKKKNKSIPYNMGVRGPILRTPSGFAMYHIGGIAEDEEKDRDQQ